MTDDTTKPSFVSDLYTLVVAPYLHTFLAAMCTVVATFQGIGFTGFYCLFGAPFFIVCAVDAFVNKYRRREEMRAAYHAEFGVDP